ncbi:MAG: UvrD-helicase domain-containing protein, partial [Candidatus Marinimicrobia bacterium]|nr:UvrD-helicase domain-containing protein [Candidatus Neomarinimicrobiota bacterium]
MTQATPLERALNCDKSVFIQACAGAGKTFALTKRYAAILDDFAKAIENGADPGSYDHKQILVITFTKKATGEMNRRIYEDVNTLLSGNEINEFKGTGFCNFLRTSKNKNVREFTERLKDTFSQNSISTIDSFCAGILREFAYKLDLDPQFLSQDEHDTKKLLNETIDNWISEKLIFSSEYFNDLLEEFSFYEIKEILKSMYGSREVLDEYINDFETKSEEQIWKDWLTRYTPGGEIENLVATFEAMWKNALDLCVNKEDDLYKGVEDLHAELIKLDKSNPLEYRTFLISEVFRKSIFVTGGGTYLRKKTGQVGNWKDKKERVMGWFQNLKDTIPEDEILKTPGPQDKKIIPILKDLIIKFNEFNEHFSEIRKKRDLLDFSDIIILTHRLLEKHADVRNILGKRYRHIMLDEFQDTNPLRWQIIEMILNAGNDIKLFIVGDRKQSIYRFNNADVTVMDTAQEVVNTLGGDIIDFNDNYRSSDKFINEAINPLMTDILKKPNEDREKYEAVFENTESQKNKEGIKETTIERIWCEHTGEDEEYIPAFHTAYQVKRLLKNYEHSRIDEKPDEPLIGVLLRRGTKLGEYLQAFHKWHIPVSILGGKDFYTTPAVMDIFYFLSVLDNPLDDHALIGLLRSPFFALSDPAINKLAHRGKNSVFDTMSSYPELQHVYHEILIWKELSKTMALDELIAKVIDSEDRELGYVSELMPEQQLANFDKALNIIRGLQRSGFSLHEIREFLHYQITTKADEPQAIYPTKARVQILTVHKAKGLEFPIVVIPEMNTKGNSDKNKFRYGRSHGHPEISLSLSDDEKPGLLTRLKEITKNEEDAEDKRVFYVAVTRAIHKVVLLGEGEKALANSWWAKYTLNHPGDPDKGDLLPENWPSNIKIINKNTVIAPTDRKNIETLPWKNRTQFDEPGKYLYRSPHDLMGESDGFNGGSGSAHGAVYGDLFHACMERGWLDARHHNNEIRSFVSNRYPDLSQEELMAKLTHWLGTVRSHELADIILDPAIEKYPEHKIKAWLGNGKDVMQVNGTIDLLYKNNDQWVILDYKTDADKHRLPVYRKQLQSYQWMVKQIYGIDAIAKIFFVSLNEIEEIKWNNSYFDELSFNGTFTPELPDSPMDISKLKSEIKAGKHLILCASAQHEEQVILALSSEGSLRPDIKISTLSKFLQENCEKGISQDRLRLMIRHRNHGMKNGTADLLAKALRDEELKKGKIKSEFHQYLGDIKSAPEYRSAAEPYYQASADGQRILLLDVYAETELEKHLIQRLSHETEVLRLSLSPDKKTGEYTLLKSFSPREEVLACAKHIKENRTRDEQVFIAVASMEKYAPHLERQFPEYGLRARFISPRSLYEVPCINLLMNYLKLCSQDKKDKQKWSDLAPVLLHPIMKTKDLFYGFDKDIRKHPLDEGTVSESGLNICNKTSDLLENVRKFADSLKNDDDPDTCKACESFIKLLEKVIVDLTRLDPKTDINTIYREMAERVKSESIPRRDQWNGIPVVGLLDSLGVHADKLYVLG